MKNQIYFPSYFIISILFLLIKGNIGISFYGTSKDKYYQVEYFNNRNCEDEPVQYQAILKGTEYCFAMPLFQVDCSGGFQNSTKECYFSSSCYCGEECRIYVNLNECVQDRYSSLRIVYQIINYKEMDHCQFTETHSLTNLSDERVSRYRLDGLQVYKKGFCLYGGNIDCDENNMYFYYCNSTNLSIQLQMTLLNNAISNTSIKGDLTGYHYFYPNDPNFLIRPIPNNAFNTIGSNFKFPFFLFFIILFIS
ncbi:hypothetical protein ACTFIZ_002112 [Dictyostelium cf. discoideum]